MDLWGLVSTFAGETSQNIRSSPNRFRSAEMRDCLCCGNITQDDSSIESPRLYLDDIPSSSSQSVHQIIESCTVNGKLDLRLLQVRQPQLYSEFHRYLSVRYSEENLDCWLALDHILETTDRNVAISLLRSAFDTYFIEGSTSQISCTEIYPPMRQLHDEAEDLSLERIQHIIAQMQYVLECSALQQPLNDWLRELLYSQVTNFGLFESNTR